MKARKKSRGVTTADLKDDYEGHVFLYCEECFGEFSACKSDYWYMPADEVFTCNHGGAYDPPANMRLVRRETRLVGVR
jgi:hypothetical protein